MNDQEFLKGFHERTLSSENFRHRDHLRLAWLVLRRHSLEEALSILSNEIRLYATSKGATSTFNETLTRFWIRLVNHVIQTNPNLQEFERFLNAYPYLLEKQLQYLSLRQETLSSPGARPIGLSQIFIRPHLANHYWPTAPRARPFSKHSRIQSDRRPPRLNPITQ